MHINKTYFKKKKERKKKKLTCLKEGLNCTSSCNGARARGVAQAVECLLGKYKP
jgi:hypothetical protein